MSITQQLYTRLPDKTQLQIANRLLEYNLLYRIPLFKMFFHTLEAFGGSRSEMLEALEAANRFDQSFYLAWKDLGMRLRKGAEQAEKDGDFVHAKERYFRSAMYHLVGDWPLPHGPLKKRNYAYAMNCFDQFKRFHLPQTEKIELPFRRGKIMANLRFPRNKKGPFPAVIIYQGNDSVKEFMVSIEDYALEHGIATLSVDQPGFGESGMSGNLLDSSKAAALAAQNATRYLKNHPKIKSKSIAAFGFSFGGFSSLYSAGLSKDIRAVATIGAPIRLPRVYKDLSFLMKQRTFQWSGCKSDNEVLSMLKDMDIRGTIAQANCPALVYHGSLDEVVPKSEAHLVAETLGSHAELRLVEDGNHTCAMQLDEILPEVFTWMQDKLQ
jgi:pimeloyl-ACP methyl ester carboxylesterase